MAVFKELDWVIRMVNGRSHQIYPDAADYGVPITHIDDPLIMMVKSVREQYDGKTETDHYATGATQTISILGIDEFGTGKSFDVKFVWVTTRSDRKRTGMIGYLYVLIGELK